MTFERMLTCMSAGAGTLLLGAAVALAVSPGQIVIQNDEARDIREVVPGGPGPVPGAGAAKMAPGTAMIVGQAIEAPSGRPVAGAIVSLIVRGVPPLRVMADGEGRFVFRGLPNGNFALQATKPGYADGAFGRSRPQGPPLALSLESGERRADVNLTLWKHAVITGFVIDEAGEPMVGTAVRVLKKTYASGRLTLVNASVDQTDDRGLYRVGSLEPGEYIVAVPDSQAGPVNIEVGDMARGPVTMALSTPPMASAPASLMGVSMTPAFLDAGGSSYGTVFFPSATSASGATAVTLAAGEERNGIDFQLRPVRTSRISGTIVGGPDGPAARMTVSLVPASGGELVSPLELRSTPAGPGGLFTFASVPEGQYVLKVVQGPRGAAPGDAMSFTSVDGMVRVERSVVVAPAGGPPPLPTGATLWAELPVSVAGEDISGADLVLRPALTVSGQIEWMGNATRPDAAAVSRTVTVTLEPADGRTSLVGAPVRGQLSPNGTFTTTGALPGKYYVRASGLPQGWFFRGATMSGTDVSDLPLEISSEDVTGVVLSFSDRRTEIVGTVAVPEGAVDSAITVLAFPAARESWTSGSSRLFVSTRTDQKGSYRMVGLPPGQYYLAAVPDALASDWQRPSVLESLTGAATLIELHEGQRLTQSLKVVR